MARTTHRRSTPRQAGTAAIAVAAATACLVATAPPAAADEHSIPLPAGTACSFDVELVVGKDGKRDTRTFVDRNGNPVVLTTGRAESVVVTNVETDTSVTVPSRGAATRETANADGSTTVEFNGNLLLFLFESDIGGDGLTPTSSTLIAGRTVYTVSPTGVFTVQSVSGRTTDICELLAP